MSLFPFERRWAVAVLEGFAPPGGPGLAPRPGEADFLGTHLRIYEASGRGGRLALRMAVFVTALSPLWLFERVATFAGLPPEGRAVFLSRLLKMRGPVGELANVM